MITRYRMKKLILVTGLLLVLGISYACSENKRGADAEMYAIEMVEGYEMADDTVSLAAIEYLKNPEWTKSEMEQYPDLAGLFDALNRFDFDAITLRYKEKLKDSPEFQTLVKHIEYNIMRGLQEAAKNKTAGGTFLEPGDEVITVSAYQNWVNDMCSKSEKPEVSDSSTNTSDNSSVTSYTVDKEKLKSEARAKQSQSQRLNAPQQRQQQAPQHRQKQTQQQQKKSSSASTNLL